MHVHVYVCVANYTAWSLNYIGIILKWFLFKDVGLIVEFSAFELMMFFGALHHLPLKRIRERMETLVNLLEIPSLYQRIQSMR